MGIAEQVRAAGLARPLPDGHLHRALAGRAAAGASCASLGGRGEGADRQIRRRRAAARALSAHLAVHARAAAEVDRRDVAERHRALRLRARVVRRRMQLGRTARSRPATAPRQRSAPHTWSAATAAAAPCASSSASSSTARPTSSSFGRRCIYCEDLYERIPIGKGRHYHVADAEASFLIVQDSTAAFHPAFRRRDRRRHGDDVRARPSPCRVEYEMLYVGQWKQNLLLAERYGDGPRLPRRRRRASRHSDRRPRHEHRRRRRHRPVVEARGDAAGMGRAATCSRPTRSSAGRSASATWRPRASRPQRAQELARTVSARNPRADTPAGRHARSSRASPTSSSARRAR